MPTISATTWDSSFWDQALADDFDNSINNLSQALLRLEGIELESFSGSSTRLDGTLTNGGSVYIIGRGLDTSQAVISQLVVDSRPELFLDMRGSFNGNSGRLTYMKFTIADIGFSVSGALSVTGSSVSGTASQVSASLGSKSLIVDGSLSFTSSGLTGTVTRLFLVDGSQTFEASGGTWPSVRLMPLTNHSSLMDTLASGSETQNGFSERDLFAGSAGNDTINGGGGLDTMVFSGLRSQYSLSAQSATALRVTDSVPTRNGSDWISDVERLKFSDVSLAFDLSGNAGTTAKILGAVFGKAAVANKAYAGIGLHYLDNLGYSYEQLMGLAINEALGPTPTNGQVVDLLYKNVVGVLPDAATKAMFIGMLDRKEQTIGSLGVLAAETDLNKTNIDLVGLAKTGLEYEPFQS